MFSRKQLTYHSPVLLFYTPRKHQKTFRFSDVFRGYRKATPGCNGLNIFQGISHKSILNTFSVIMLATLKKWTRNINFLAVFIILQIYFWRCELKQIQVLKKGEKLQLFIIYKIYVKIVQTFGNESTFTNACLHHLLTTVKCKLQNHMLHVTGCEICSKLIIKTSSRRQWSFSGIFINFD